jgi:hypothetical protein
MLDNRLGQDRPGQPTQRSSRVEEVHGGQKGLRRVRPQWKRPALLGVARSRLLALLESPSTTSDLAARTGLSLGAVSQPQPAGKVGLLLNANALP